tara:strand:- start:164 stop:310 length:147 start_codon:yes stop_codon:yes gene_type:complete
MSAYQNGLDPTIKAFIAVVSIVGPLAIAGLLFILKKIENHDPKRIRWK